MYVGKETDAVDASKNADAGPVPCRAAPMQCGEVCGRVVRDDAHVREVTKAGLANGMKNAVELSRLLTSHPTRCVHVRGERVAPETRDSKPSGSSLRGITVHQRHAKHGWKVTAL